MLTLSGTNAYGGGTTISGGVLAYTNSYSVPDTGTITIGPAGALAATPIYSSTAAPVTGWLNSGPIAANPMGAIALTGSANDTETITLSSSFGSLSLGAALGGSATYGGTLTPFGSTYYLGGGGGTLNFTPSSDGRQQPHGRQRRRRERGPCRQQHVHRPHDDLRRDADHRPGRELGRRQL